MTAPGPSVSGQPTPEPGFAEPPPVGEGAALIAATEQEIADMGDEWIGVTRLAAQRDRWAETARTLARALDGRPAAPVQPEERRDGMDDADFDYAMTPERHAERIRGMNDTYRATSWWSFAEATHAQLMRVLAERDEWAGRAQLAEVDLRMARAALATAEREREALCEEVQQRADDLAVLKPLAEDVDRRTQRLVAAVRALADDFERQASVAITAPARHIWTRAADAMRALLSPPAALGSTPTEEATDAA